MREHPDDLVVDAYVEGMLDAAERASLEAHLAACGRCRVEVERQRALIVGLRGLPKTVEPDVDLRPGIRAAIRVREQADARSRWMRSLRVPLAAAAALLIAVTAGVTTLLLADREGDDRFARTEDRTVLLASFDARRADYTRTADELAAVLQRHRDELSPETVALVEENLRTIDRALGEAEAALRADPASPAVRELILATQEHKVDVLRWANSLVRG